MSKTERDLTSHDSDDALGEMFASEDFESSLDEALDGADLDLDLDPDVDDDIEPSDTVDDLDGDEGEVVDQAEPDGVLDDETVTETVRADDLDDEHHASDVEDTDSDDVTSDVRIDTPTDDTDESPHGDATVEALPEIVPATPDGETADEIAARDIDVADRDGADPDDDIDDDIDDEEVSDRILEELRRADIDGPVVPLAPQDDTTTARRRPRRPADYDPAPVPIPAKVPRVLGRKPRVRKVTRVVRHVDPWSVFKIALVAHMVLYITVLTASVLLWNVAYSTNTIDNVERFFESFGWNSFEFNGGELYHAGWIAGLFVVIGLTGLAVLAATLFNLITDLVGGVRFTVLEEEVVEARTSPMRRFVVRRSEPEVPALLRDGSGAMTREAVVDDAGANDRPTR